MNKWLRLYKEYKYSENYDDKKLSPRGIFTNAETLISASSATLAVLKDVNKYKIYDVSSWGIADGYWLVLLSPIVVLYWIFISILFLPILILLAVVGISALISVIWCLLFEIPSDVLNKNKINRLTDEFIKAHPDIIGKDVREIDLETFEIKKEK